MSISGDFKLKVKKLSSSAIVPERSTYGSVGYDLFSAVTETIAPGGKACISTNIAVEIPMGYYGRIAPRSSLAWKMHIGVGGGVIDPDYRGSVGVVLFNHGPNEFVVCEGDRIAQLIIEKVATPEIEVVDELSDTNRGEGGFGSTGK